MDYNTLLDLTTNLGYELAMAGAETFRVEESIQRIMAAYGVQAEVFAITNYLMISITDDDGKAITRMRRIGSHGNNLDSVEKFSNLSRAICNRKPAPEEGVKWLEHVRRDRLCAYSLPIQYVGYFLGAAGHTLFFGGNWLDSLCGGICGMLVGFVSQFLSRWKSNTFFNTIASAFFMAMLAYGLHTLGITQNPDAVNIGALMILVPGLLFTNAMRDIIYGDTNSGINRIVQVALIAMAIALGTATAWQLASAIWVTPVSIAPIQYPMFVQCAFAFFGCMGFVIVFNIHGKGFPLCALGGALTWAVYLIAQRISGSDLVAYFWAALTSSLYSEIMARIRKSPAIAYLVISIFPIIPGAGAYYTMNYAVQGEMELFASKGMFTAAIAGVMAVGILLGSSGFRMYSDWKMQQSK